jgi:hypothetical protein
MASDESSKPVAIRAEIALLEDLFEEIRRGKLRALRFHRSFVWRQDDMRKLLDSVNRGLPIGSLVLWEPGERYECLSNFGPVVVGDRDLDSRDISYVLDGQHRLMTLFGVTHVTDDSLTPDPRQWRIWYDLEADEFVHAVHGSDGPHWLPLGSLLRTTDFLRFCSELLRQRPEAAPALIERAERLSRLLRGYRLPVVRVRGGGLEDAIEIVSRLNSSGQMMAEDQMVSIVTYREGDSGFDLAASIAEILEALGDVHFDGIGRLVVFRTLTTMAGMPITPRAQAAWLVRRLDAYGRGFLLAQTTKGLLNASRWLDAQGVRCDRLLPYALQLILLANFFSEREPTPEESATLRRWFFATSFAGWFAGGNTTQVNNDLAEMGKFARREISTFAALDERTLPFPERFDLRSARVRAFLLSTLLQRTPLRRRGQPVDVVSIFQADEAASVPRVFPRMAGPGFSKPANRILLPSADGRGARQQLLDLLEDERDEVLASHCIDEAAWNALRNNDAEGFVAARTKHLIGLERAFMEQHHIRLPERETEEPPIDTGS